MRTIRVGNAGGYWGDDSEALYQQITQGPLDYVTLDFLAEVTMSVLQKQRSRNPDLGYATDFLDQMRSCLPVLTERKIRLITNAGGLNPRGCARGVQEMACQSGVKLKIAIVEGDDLTHRLVELQGQGVALAHLETGEPFQKIRSRVESANAYLGAAPLVEALKAGAEIIITGRVSDAALAMAPPIFEFGWDLEDWDRLASAAIGGHILECGAQSSGGNFTDWETVPSFQNIGYPIAEFSPGGTFCVSKHDGTGGLVNRHTVTSQLIYEIGDPSRYVTPDVIADFRTIHLEEAGPDRVRVFGIKGRPRPHELKVSVSYRYGYQAFGTMIVSRPRALEKARTLADIFWRRLGVRFENSSTEFVGHSAAHRHMAPETDPPEILLRLGVRDPARAKLEAFSRKWTSLILNTVPGVAIVGARPRIQEVFAYWPCLVPASVVTPQVSFLDEEKSFSVPWVSAPESNTASEKSRDREGAGPGNKFRVPQPTAEVSEIDTGSRSLPARLRSGFGALKRSQPKPWRRLVAALSDDPSEASVEDPSEGSVDDPLQASVKKCRLLDLCYARSGDKGDSCNIGIVGRSESIYGWMLEYLTAARVQDYFGELCRGGVERFELPNLLALNFVLHRCLDGGGTLSLRIDPQGKTLAEALLMMAVEVPGI